MKEKESEMSDQLAKSEYLAKKGLTRDPKTGRVRRLTKEEFQNLPEHLRPKNPSTQLEDVEETISDEEEFSDEMMTLETIKKRVVKYVLNDSYFRKLPSRIAKGECDKSIELFWIQFVYGKVPDQAPGKNSADFDVTKMSDNELELLESLVGYVKSADKKKKTNGDNPPKSPSDPGTDTSGSVAC